MTCNVARAVVVVLILAVLVPQSTPTLHILLFGDPQYHFPCEPTFAECIAASGDCYIAANRTRDQFHGVDDCIIIESEYANMRQKEAINRVLLSPNYNISTIVINGDLTNFGRQFQYTLFEEMWMRNYSRPIDNMLLGLGNHDMQNAIDDCFENDCVNRMLTKLMEYADSKGLRLDVERNKAATTPRAYKGSFSYATSLCDQQDLCVDVLQLQNRLEQADTFRAFDPTCFCYKHWTLLPSLHFLKAELERRLNSSRPLLVNIHQCEREEETHLQDILKNWVERKLELGISLDSIKVAVFFAHQHGRHGVKRVVRTSSGVPIPFVYVGSVPNGRFSILQLTTSENGSTSAGLTGFDTNSDGNGETSKFHLSDMWSRH